MKQHHLGIFPVVTIRGTPIDFTGRSLGLTPVVRLPKAGWTSLTGGRRRRVLVRLDTFEDHRRTMAGMERSNARASGVCFNLPDDREASFRRGTSKATAFGLTSSSRLPALSHPPHRRS